MPVEDARRFVGELRATSQSPAFYAELAGAEHAFDILPSVRTARVVETIERFLATIRSRDRARRTAPDRSVRFSPQPRGGELWT